MNPLIARYEQTVDSLPLQVRIFVLAIALAVIFLLWSFILWVPIQDKKDRVDEQIVATTKSIETTKQGISDLEKRHSEVQVKIKEHAQITAEEEKNQQQQASLSPEEQAKLVAQQQLPEIMKYLISFRHGLTFLNVQLTSPRPLEIKKDTAEVSNYMQRDITIKFIGNYFTILNYLQNTEKQNFPIYWDKLDYKVKAFPLAEVTLQLHVLSAGG